MNDDYRGRRMTMAEQAQEADVCLAIAHFTQASMRLLPEDSDLRPKLERLATACGVLGRERLPANPRPSLRRLQPVAP